MFKNLYTLAVGILLGITVSVTLSFAFPSPKMPEYPSDPNAYNTDPMISQSPQMEQEMNKQVQNYAVQQKEYDKQMKVFNKQSSEYAFTANLYKLGAAVVLLIIAALCFGRIPFMPEAFVAGGAIVLLGVSSSTFVSFYNFDPTSMGDSSFKISVTQLSMFYILTIAALAIGYYAQVSNKLAKTK